MSQPNEIQAAFDGGFSRFLAKHYRYLDGRLQVRRSDDEWCESDVLEASLAPWLSGVPRVSSPLKDLEESVNGK